MAHTSIEKTANPAEAEFTEIMRRADDFFKISLLRQAKNGYLKALQSNIETDKVKQLIVECDRQLAFENKVALILGAVALVLVAAALLIW